jgi:hypothetical protein
VDWKRWHKGYDDPGSSLSRRLEAVRTLIRGALDEAPAGRLHVVSACAGEGRDLIPVLADHWRGRDVRARLVELDPELADRARHEAAAAGLTGVDVVTGDASLTDQYLDLAPANLVLMCGIYGNITPQDIETTVAACAGLCARGGTVVWTRGRMNIPGGDLVPQICDWYEERGFEQVWLSAPEAGFGVGAHRLTVDPAPLVPGQRMFEFLGYDVLRARVGDGPRH